jgi:hypothetical protein
MVKVTLVQALRLCTGRTAHRGSRGIALLFLDHGTRRGWGSASRPGRSLHPGKTRCPLYRRLCGPQGRSAQVRKISLPPGFDPRTVQPVASRYTDYRLSTNRSSLYFSFKYSATFIIPVFYVASVCKKALPSIIFTYSLYISAFE